MVILKANVRVDEYGGTKNGISHGIQGSGRKWGNGKRDECGRDESESPVSLVRQLLRRIETYRSNVQW